MIYSTTVREQTPILKLLPHPHFRQLAGARLHAVTLFRNNKVSSLRYDKFRTLVSKQIFRGFYEVRIRRIVPWMRGALSESVLSGKTR